LTCKCGCGLIIIESDLVALVQKIADESGRKIDVHSWTRCQWNNARSGGVVGKKYLVPGTNRLDISKYPRGARGGSKDSNHTHGTAADIELIGASADDLWALIKRLHSEKKLPRLAGLGRYDTFCHVDVAPKRAKLREWDERKRK
jgi:hypothetical protein